MGEKDPSRRASDDTRQRIDRLAGGWEMPVREVTPEEAAAARAKIPPPPPVRPKGGSRPPPPPPVAAVARPAAPVEVREALAADVSAVDVREAADTVEVDPPDLSVVVEREDPTDAGRDDDATRIDPVRRESTPAGPRAGAAGSSLRAPATFRRRGGLSGDVLYVGTVLFGGAAARRELGRLAQAIEAGRTRRNRTLVALGADAIGEPSLDDDRLAAAREALALIEDDRSERAGQAAAAEADVAAIQRSERGEIERRTQEGKALEAELATLAEQLAPLEKEAQGIRRRAGELRATLGRLDDRIRDTESKLVSVRGGKADRAGVEAELASLRADRVSVAKDEPALAAELDALTPRLTALEAERNRASRRLVEARAAIAAAGERATDELGAVQAARRVIDRGLGDLERRRDRALADLGEHLATERPAVLATPLAALDEAELAIATDERRAVEVREMLGSVDRMAVARGVAMLLLIAALLGGFGWFIATRH